ncbi:MAG: PHP domain-containing protein [Leptolyngbya sp. ERB_1_2]
MAANLASSSMVTTQSPQDAVALRQVFASLTAESCPLTYNFHMHTTHSDGQLHPEALAQQAIDLSLKGFAITDHHEISGYRVARRYIQAHRNDLAMPYLWTGTEITSRLLETEVHILGFAFDPEHSAIASYLQGAAPQGDRAQAARVISAIHHPARYRRSADELIPAAAMVGIDGVETFYAYNNPKPWMPSPKETDQVKQLKTQYDLLSSCGTDTHGMSLLQRL